MARFMASVPLNMTYRPSLAPWRGESVLICANPGARDGEPLQAGVSIEVPDRLAFAIDHDLQRLVPGGIEWLDSPSAEALEAQRAEAVAYAPQGHPLNP